jgi:hypothetical protein
MLRQNRTYFRRPSSAQDAYGQLAQRAAMLARLAGWTPKDVARAFVSVPPLPRITSLEQWAKLSPMARSELELQARFDVEGLPTRDGFFDLPEPLRSLVDSGIISEAEGAERFSESVKRYEEYVGQLQDATPVDEPGPNLGGADLARAARHAIRDCQIAGVAPRDLLVELGRTPRLNVPQVRAAFDGLSSGAQEVLGDLLPDFDPNELPSGKSELDGLPAQLKQGVLDRQVSFERAQHMVQTDVDAFNGYVSGFRGPSAAATGTSSPLTDAEIALAEGWWEGHQPGAKPTGGSTGSQNS